MLKSKFCKRLPRGIGEGGELVRIKWKEQFRLHTGHCSVTYNVHDNKSDDHKNLKILNFDLTHEGQRS